MPNPKRRHSKQRTAKRRSHDFLTPSNSNGCPNCGERKQSHRACPKCGMYGSGKEQRVVIAVEQAS
jgi:large subunit ribosomal protein L32